MKAGWRSLYILGFGVPLLLGALTEATADVLPDGDGTAVPKLVCAEPEFDYGERDNNETVVHEFVLHNEGRAPLVIGNIRTSCGCTVAEVGGKTILPGGSTRLTARLSLRGRQGKQHKSIRVESNDPVQPHLRLWLKGTAVSELAAVPHYLNLGQLAPDTKRSDQIRITSRHKGLSIRDVDCDSEFLRVDAGRSASDEPVVTVRTQPPLDIGALRASIRIRTNHPDEAKRDLEVPVFASVRGEIVVIPRELILRKRSAGPITRAILLRPGTKRLYTVRHVAAPDPAIKIQIEQQSEGSFRIDLRDVPVKEDLDGTSIRIETTADKMKIIEVPIRIVP